jgi:pimeloyl-ACP methyl ester carboxylesterase
MSRPILLLLAAGVLHAQLPDTQTLARTVQGTHALIPEARALLEAGQSGEARRKLAQAQAQLSGKPWGPKEEFLWSLAFRPQRLAIDPGMPQTIELAQVYPAAYKPSAELKLRVGVIASGTDSKLARPIATVAVPQRDLAADPLKFQADFSGTTDGAYKLTAELMEGDAPLVTMQHSVGVAEGIESRFADTERRLAKVVGHESAKASVRWPFDIARVVNLGIRRLETTDFGLPEKGPATFDFAKELKDSAEILKALESGKDPLVKAKGDRERHYFFEEAREIMPYRVYVPTNWDGKKQLPMIFVLHGNTRDHNFYFDRDGGILAKLAEKNGFLVATTMGYRPNAGYNAGRRSPQGELSEKDAMRAFDLIVQEYNPDRSRIYLFGHSAGGTGGWHIAGKYPEKFAGIALSAFVTQPAGVQWDKLAGMPILVIVGSKDTPRTVETARNMAKAVKEKGFETQFLELPEATHDTIVGLSLPTVYEFFTKRQKKKA